MASSYPGRVSATQVGSYFVGQYYLGLQQQPDRVHQFYTEGSTMIRVDGDLSESASAMLEIHRLLISLNFTAIEIKTINSLDSWNGGVLVMVSGLVKTRDFNGRRNFVQSFFLAPQEKGYFVLNDIFQFLDDGRTYQHQAPIPLEANFETQSDPSNNLPELPVSDYVLEEEAQDYVNSIHIEDDLVDKYSLPEQQQQEDFETEIVVEETPIEEPSPSFQSVVNTVHEAPAPAVEEPVGEAPKRTYASILRVSKGQPAASVASQPSLHNSSPAASDWNHTLLPAAQQSNFVPSFVPEAGVDAVEEGLEEEEGEPKSVYVRNLPPNVTEAEIEEEFKNFGKIIPDGIFIRLRKEIGLCYAFVEFEDLIGVQNALKASPIQLAGRQVYIEERRPNSSSAYRGGRRGRGRGSYQTEAPKGRFGGRSLGRGSNQDSGEYNRLRGNDFYQRGSR